MTSWTRPPDILDHLRKKWKQGVFLRQAVEDEGFSPFRIPLKRPSPAQCADQFDEVRKWIADLAPHGAPDHARGYTIEWRETNHRILGKNRIPAAVVFHTLADVLACLRRTRAAETFRSLYLHITGQYPELAPLFKKYPLKVLAHETVWPEITAILAFMKANPRPMIYIRQLEISGVDTKFMEQHKAWLTMLLDQVIHPDHIDESAAGSGKFEKRFGFLYKPARIRFRLLDPEMTIGGLTDIQVPFAEFRHLPIRPRTVFIVENKVNGLAFPPFPQAMVIFGLGYGVNLLSDTPWLAHCHIRYWGDIDTHGFAMLDQVREAFPHARSFLMDTNTLLSHRRLWGSETAPTDRNLTRLTPEEDRLYRDLITNKHGHRLRLEQERIDFSRVKQSLEDTRRWAD